MKIKKKFVEKFAEHDKFVMEAYIKKEKTTLKKELLHLENERSMMLNHMHRIEAIIEKHDKLQKTLTEEQLIETNHEDSHGLWPHLETQIKEWEMWFAKIWSKKPEDHSRTEREYIEKELPLLKMEKSAVQERLMNMEGIIAKARMLMDDLNKDLCRNFSRGRILTEVGEIILHEFGHKINEPYSAGRKIIRNCLELKLEISKTASRKLFSLLEDTGILCYRAGLPENFKDVPLMYYSYAEEIGTGVDMGVLYQLNGWWEIIV